MQKKGNNVGTGIIMSNQNALPRFRLESKILAEATTIDFNIMYDTTITQAYGSQNSSRVAGTAKEREEVYANDWKESGLWHCTVMGGGGDTR